MYQKYLIVISKKDIAGMSIGRSLLQFGNFEMYLVEEEIIYDNNLDKNKINQYDFIIFASRHESEKKEKTISIHAPGNFGEVKFGGSPNEVCKTSALFQKQLFKKLQENIEKFHIKKYKLTLECTHHGPLIEKPCIFVEIGSTEREWKDTKASFVIAKSVSEIISEFKENPYNEIAIGIGGPHYCPSFNKIQLNTNVAISHIIPEYCLPLTEEMIKETLKKTEEEYDFVVLDWKGLGNSEKKQQTLDVLNNLYIKYKKTSEINR